MAPNDPVRTVWQRKFCEEHFLIADGETDSNVIDFGHNYKVFGITCKQADGIQTGSKLMARVDWGCGDLVTLYQQDDPNTIWEPEPPGGNESFGFILTHAFGAKRLQLYLDTATEDDVVLKVIPLDQGDLYQ